MTAGGFDTIAVSVEDGVAEVVLDRPDAHNTIDLCLAEELLAAAHDLHRRGDVRAVLLRGSGRWFCAGGDLRSFADVGDEVGHHLELLVTSLHGAILRLRGLDAPLVAAVQGSVAGAGFSLACGADLLVAGASTRFVMAYGAVGLTPDGAGSWFLPRLVGLGRALDLALTNRVLSAAEAEAWGIVTRVVPDDDVEAEGRALARSLAAGPTRSFGATRRLLHASLGRSLEEQVQEEQRELSAAADRADGREGIAAFLEKRAPVFEGR